MRFALALLAIPLCAQGTFRQPAPSTRINAALAPAPNYFFTAGGGDQAPGRGAGFVYWSASRYLGQQSWATVLQEYSMSAGQVITCPLGGISHVVGSFGPVSYGGVGAAGACSGSPLGGTGALGAQGFANVHIYKRFSLIVTVRKTWALNATCPPAQQNTPLCRPAIRFTIGPGYSQ